MSPQRTNLVLATDIPNGEADVLVFDSLDIKAWLKYRLNRASKHISEQTRTISVIFSNNHMNFALKYSALSFPSDSAVQRRYMDLYYKHEKRHLQFYKQDELNKFI